MPDASRRTSTFVLAFLLLVLAALPVGAAPAGADAGDQGTLATAEPVRVDGAVRFEVEEGVVLSVDGERRYLDTLELLADGPTLVNELPIDDYVAGVAEMPSRWAAEALKAQAVAARTYAWYSIGLDTFDGYDICASTACQVFRGATTVLDDGERWGAAVEATAGEVLVDDAGEPILARYFSTSGGRTYANEDVFPSSGPRDYLVAIDDPDDEASPYHRWTVRFTRDEFDDILSRGETLGAAVPVASVERLGDVGDHDADLRVTGTDGTAVEVSAGQLRDFLSAVAPERYPDRFPTVRSDGLRPLPSTIPSTRFEVEVADDEVVVEGQGWGHGVGMGQYGARGRAERGQEYDDILADYYNGLRPTTAANLPERIRVGMDVGDQVTVRADGPFRVTTVDGQVLADQALGTWTADRDDGGWTLTPPPGTDAPLQVSPTRTVSDTDAVRDAVTVEAEVNKPVLLRLEVVDPAGATVVERDLGVGDAGTHAATWRFTDGDGGAVDPGDYEVTLVGEDAGATSAGDGVAVTVTEDGARSAASLTDDRSDGLPGVLLFVLVAAIALPLSLIVVVLATRKARR